MAPLGPIVATPVTIPEPYGQWVFNLTILAKAPAKLHLEPIFLHI